MNFDEPTPTDAVNPPVAAVTAALSSATRVCRPAGLKSSSRVAARRSTKASSSESGSITGDSSRRIPITWSLAIRYAPNRVLRKAALGQRRRASWAGIAERTPKTRASYEAVATTPRWPTPPTTTGLPRSEGLSRCSTEAKKASRSRWSIEASRRTGSCSHLAQTAPLSPTAADRAEHAVGVLALHPGQ